MSELAASPVTERQEMVPDRWPAARSDVPAPVRFPSGLLALPGMFPLWLFPRTMGVRLAAAGWGPAVAAHFLGMLLGAGLVAWAYAFPQTNPIGVLKRPAVWATSTVTSLERPIVGMAWSEYPRVPLAALAAYTHAKASKSGGIDLLGLVLGVEAGLVVVALLLMPAAAAGESTRRLFGRCLRLTWWSTTMLIPLGIGFMLDPLFRKWLDLPNRWVASDYARIALFGFWWVWVLIRSGYQYAGPAKGPGWAERTPYCEGCGYIIAHIPVSTKCPECGRPVVDSLPQRRCAPPFAGPEARRPPFSPFLSTCRMVLFERSFFDRLSVHQGHARARWFFFLVCVVAVVTVFGPLLLFAGVTSECDLKSDSWYIVVFACAGVPAVLACGGLAAMLAAVIGRRTMQSAAIASFYGFASLLPLTWALLLFLLALLAVSFQLASEERVWLFVASMVVAMVIVADGWLGYISARCMVAAFTKTRRAQG